MLHSSLYISTIYYLPSKALNMNIWYIMWISLNEIGQLDPCISYVNPWKVVITYEKRRIFFSVLTVAETLVRFLAQILVEVKEKARNSINRFFHAEWWGCLAGTHSNRDVLRAPAPLTVPFCPLAADHQPRSLQLQSEDQWWYILQEQIQRHRTLQSKFMPSRQQPLCDHYWGGRWDHRLTLFTTKRRSRLFQLFLRIPPHTSKAGFRNDTAHKHFLTRVKMQAPHTCAWRRWRERISLRRYGTELLLTRTMPKHSSRLTVYCRTGQSVVCMLTIGSDVLIFSRHFTRFTL